MIGWRVLPGAAVKPSGGQGYLDAATALGALTVQDGFNDALTGSPYTKLGTVVAAGINPDGHTAVQPSSASYLAATVPFIDQTYTLVGATNLLNGGTSDFCRLVSDSNARASLLRAAARTRVTTARHTFTADPGTWHWFAFAVDGTQASEVSSVYIDGVQSGPTIDRGDEVAGSGTSFWFGGNSGTDRHIGTFAACAVFPTALSATDVAALFDAYRNGM